MRTYNKKAIFTLLFLSGFILVQAQCIRIENGFAISSFLKHKRASLFTDNIQRYALLVGVDYLEHRHWEISSEVGYLTLGGKEKLTIKEDETDQGIEKKIIESKKYIHINTTFRVKGNIDNTCFYAGIGPKLDILAGNADMVNTLFKGYTYQRTIFGAKAEIGIYQILNEKIKVGLNASYLPNFGSTMESDFVKQKSKAFMLTLSLGYCL